MASTLATKLAERKAALLAKRAGLLENIKEKQVLAKAASTPGAGETSGAGGSTSPTTEKKESPLLKNTNIVEKKIEAFTNLKENPDKQIEIWTKKIDALGTGEGLTGAKLKAWEIKKKNYEKILAAYKKNSEKFGTMIENLKASLPGEEPPPAEPPAEPPVEPPPSPVPGGSYEPVGGESMESESGVGKKGALTVAEDLAMFRGRKGKQTTILTSPEGVMSAANRMLRKIARVA